MIQDVVIEKNCLYWIKTKSIKRWRLSFYNEDKEEFILIEIRPGGKNICVEKKDIIGLMVNSNIELYFNSKKNKIVNSKAEKLAELFREKQNVIIICSIDDIEDFKKGTVKRFTEGKEEYWREDTKEDEGVNSLSILAKRRTFLLIDEKDQFNFYNIMIDSIK